VVNYRLLILCKSNHIYFSYLLSLKVLKQHSKQKEFEAQYHVCVSIIIKQQ